MVLRKQDGNPSCLWFLFFWGSIVVLFLVVNEMFGPVSLFDELQEKWDKLGEKTHQRSSGR